MSKFKANDELFLNYLEVLKSKVYKILPLMEEKNSGVFQYLLSLTNEIKGLSYVIEGVQNSHNYLSLLATLETFTDVSLDDEHDMKFVRSEIFKCLSTIKKLKGEE